MDVRHQEIGDVAELETERLHGHFIGDPVLYRSEEDRKAQQDPIPLYRQRLLDEGVLSQETATGLEARAKTAVDAAMQFARDSEYPAATEALTKLYA